MEDNVYIIKYNKLGYGQSIEDHFVDSIFCKMQSNTEKLAK